ncbi:hypothetical protein GCM10011367_03110 [Marinicauda pacifica]|uniref:STAS/SEC14 domain-containing protein n=1 Tax=Marinicauda pacifica TaxID=1133559 RepID=A0A4S2HD79_9PROT|nr:hypothetical protein [Marinicauda pacifica]TGY94000.1 hypothetical protein E5162_01550 [Marinicauda pacifica]GGE32024.1 hypothetical protein GCM10011367_03110 [Marinicauda pacifica]
MNIDYWKWIGGSCLYARIPAEPEIKDQLEPVIELLELAKSQELDGLAFDFDHAGTPMKRGEDLWQIDQIMAHAMNSSLKVFAIIDRSQRNAWWLDLVSELEKSGLEARLFYDPQLAREWVETRFNS